MWRKKQRAAGGNSSFINIFIPAARRFFPYTPHRRVIPNFYSTFLHSWRYDTNTLLQKVRLQPPKMCEPDGFGPHVALALRDNKVHPVGFLGSFSLQLSFSAKRKLKKNKTNPQFPSTYFIIVSCTKSTF